MFESSTMLLIAVALGAVAMWLMLPRSGARAHSRSVGMVVGLASLGFFASQLPWLGDAVAQTVVVAISGVTVIAAAAAVTSRKPVYAAVWFGLMLLGTAALFLVQGAQFLAVATVVVYAGAILVTFLFVLLLAQPEGRTPYDRTSTEALVSVAAGAVIVGVLSVAVGGALAAPGLAEAMPTAAQRAADVLSAQHVAHLGTELFSRHLIAVEAAGILLLVALVGAAAITAKKERKP